MSTSFFNILLAFVPFVFFVMVSLKKNVRYEIQRVSVTSSFVLCLLMSVLLGLSPIEFGADKQGYMFEFLGYQEERNEIGWVLYYKAWAKLLGGNFVFYFLITASIYTFTYYFVARKLFPVKYFGYFVILSLGSLGFVGYGNNAIRAGLSVSLFLIMLTMPRKLWIHIPFLCIIFLFHKSTIIPILAYAFSNIIKNKRPIELFWVLCLTWSILNIDVTLLFGKVGFIDERVEGYVDRAGDVLVYNTGFRFDFLLYSIIPLYIANIWMKKYRYNNCFYIMVYKTYLLSNAVWLLVIRVAFSDRFAYLSWFLIPILVLYPLLTMEIKVKNAQRVLSLILGLFIGINVILSLR